MSPSNPHANPYSDAMANDLSDYNDWRLIHINTDTTNTYDQLQAVISRWREHYHVAGEVTPRGPLPESLKTPVKWKQDQNAALFGIMSAMPEFPGHARNQPDPTKCWLCEYFENQVRLIHNGFSLEVRTRPTFLVKIPVSSPPDYHGLDRSCIVIPSTIYHTYCHLDYSNPQLNLLLTITTAPRGPVCQRCISRFTQATELDYQSLEFEDEGLESRVTGGAH